MDWKAFFDRLGLNGTHWQWKVIRLQTWWKAKTRTFGHSQPAVSQRHKFCPDCGALMDREEKECSRCGRSAPSWRTQAMQRRLAFVLPSWCAGSTLLFIAIVVLGLVRFFPEINQRLVQFGMYASSRNVWAEWISYAYLHGGWMHLAFNAVALSQLGPMIEEELGTARFFTVYTLTACTAVIGFNVTGGGALVGASGSLFGLIGCGLAFHHFTGETVRRSFFLQWAIYGVLFGFLVGGAMRVANSAHVGGLIGGLLLGTVLAKQRRHSHKLNGFWRTSAWSCLAATLYALWRCGMHIL